MIGEPSSAQSNCAVPRCCCCLALRPQQCEQFFNQYILTNSRLDWIRVPKGLWCGTDTTNCFKSSLLVAFTVMFGKLFIHFQYFVLEFGIFFSFQRWGIRLRLGNDCSGGRRRFLPICTLEGCTMQHKMRRLLTQCCLGWHGNL